MSAIFNNNVTNDTHAVREERFEARGGRSFSPAAS